MKMKIVLKHSITSYMVIFFTGILAGILTRLTDFGPRNSIWGFSSIATLFGFWIICAACERIAGGGYRGGTILFYQ